MKIIIAGSRTFNDFKLLCKKMDLFNKNKKITEIVSGCARGADQLGEKWAEMHKIKITRFPAYWDLYGKSAGYKRNVDMAEYANGLVAFWNGESSGTKHMIDTMEKLNKLVKMVRF